MRLLDPEVLDIVHLGRGRKIPQRGVRVVRYRHHMRIPPNLWGAIRGCRDDIGRRGIAAQLLHEDVYHLDKHLLLCQAVADGIVGVELVQGVQIVHVLAG